MEDYKYLIYIIGFILYSLFRAFGKKKKPVTRSKPNSGNDAGDSRPKTFEDILAELTGQKPVEEEEVVFDPIEQPLTTDIEERPLNQQISQEEYENADETLKELYKKGEKLKTLNELVDINEVQTVSKFANYEQKSTENEFTAEIKKDFSNPTSVKKAFVYSEIFNRKF